MRIGKYEVLGELGAGAMGIVFKAVDPDQRYPVAIKMIGNRSTVRATVHLDAPGKRESLDRQRRMMLVREASFTAKLSHPNIVRVLDYGQYHGLLFIVMEYLEGHSLDRLIAAKFEFSLRQKLEMGIQLAEGLAFAHGRGVVHRDIKPANTFLCSSGLVKILDFGLVTKRTKSISEVAGTINYMAPEVISGRAKDTPRVDIWSAGVTIFEILTGVSPFAGTTAAQTMYNIIHAPFPGISSQIAGAESIENVLATALAKDPGGRYPDASDLARDLLRLLLLHCSEEPTAEPRAGSNPDSQLSEAPVNHVQMPFASGLDESDSPVDIGVGRSSMLKLNAAIRNLDYVNSVLKQWLFTTVAGTMFMGWLSDRISINDRLFYQIIGFNLLLMLAGFMLFGSPKIATLALALPTNLQMTARCRNCRGRMESRSRWTRFALTDAAVELAFSDCVAALEADLWEDAAKLLSLHAHEFSPGVTNSIVSPPIRYHLEFFCCRRCNHQRARITADDKIEERWIPRFRYLEAYKGLDAKGPTRGAHKRAK